MNVMFNKMPAGNEVLEIDDNRWISFTKYENSPWTGSVLMFESDNQSDETDLVCENDAHKHRILNGDFREQYIDAIMKSDQTPDGAWDACLSVFEDHKASHESSWSK